MGILLKGTNKFFRGLGAGARRFGNYVAGGITKGARILGKDVLPVVEKVAGGIATASKYVAPVLAVSPLAEFAPAVVAAGAGAAAIQRGAKMGMKVIKQGTDVVNAVNSGIKAAKSGNVEKVVSLAQNVAPQVKDLVGTAMSIRPVPRPPFKRMGA